MKKFSFRLDRVLHWREQQAEVEEERLHLLLAELAGIQDELARWEQDKSAVETALVSFSSAEAHQLAILDHWRQHLSRLRLRIDTRMADCRKRIAQQQQAVLEARRRAQLLERLKKRGAEQWQRALDREMDQLATEIHLARRSGARNA